MALLILSSVMTVVYVAMMWVVSRIMLQEYKRHWFPFGLACLAFFVATIGVLYSVYTAAVSFRSIL